MVAVQLGRELCTIRGSAGACTGLVTWMPLPHVPQAGRQAGRGVPGGEQSSTGAACRKAHLGSRSWSPVPGGLAMLLRARAGQSTWWSGRGDTASLTVAAEQSRRAVGKTPGPAPSPPPGWTDPPSLHDRRTSRGSCRDRSCGDAPRAHHTAGVRRGCPGRACSLACPPGPALALPGTEGPFVYTKGRKTVVPWPCQSWVALCPQDL